MAARWRIGFDIGGTFTDFILLDTQQNAIRLHKCLTTPDDPSMVRWRDWLNWWPALASAWRMLAILFTAPPWSPTR